MTKKLYDLDSHRRDFTAAVLRCDADGERYAVVLDQTLFFPEGGGQPADTGVLGGARVLDVQITQEAIVHYTDAPLTPGAQVRGEIDWPQRFRRMQGHSGEHIISGLIHSEYGLDNVGFHLGQDTISMDYNGELTWPQLMHIEQLANEAVYRNVPIRTEYPSPEQLAQMTYRSKLDLTEDVRIVTVEGYDVCACCAPHVSCTGEIGAIKFTSVMRHRGGIRVTILSPCANLSMPVCCSQAAFAPPLPAATRMAIAISSAAARWICVLRQRLSTRPSAAAAAASPP